jgi:hypothetical protein
VALRADGRVACWGADFRGQCTLPGDLGPVAAIAAGGEWTLAIERDALPCVADLNGDSTVDGADLATLLSAFGQPPGDSSADIDGNGMVDGFDLARLLAAWGPCAR